MTTVQGKAKQYSPLLLLRWRLCLYKSIIIIYNLKKRIMYLESFQHTFPAKGIRKGSVQNIPRRARAMRDVLTAIDNSIGSSGGITEVIISEQLRKSLYLLLVGSSRPYKKEVPSVREWPLEKHKNNNGTIPRARVNEPEFTFFRT